VQRLIGRILVILFVAALAAGRVLGQSVAPAAAGDSLRFAVIGDNGTGERPQFEVASQMAAARATFPFEMVLMLGDNMYGRQEAQDFIDKFQRPYAALLRENVPFFGTLGNHDKPGNRDYPGFNMNGQRYYSFVRKNVTFFVFDSNALDAKQVSWIEDVLARPAPGWKICVFHHPLYSDAGRHGSNVDLRVVLEPIMVRHGVDVVFSGHEHIYERLTPQKGIHYFIAGSSGQLRKGDLVPSPTMAAGFDEDQAFMLIEIVRADMQFRAISRTGRVVDSGVIRRVPQTEEAMP
jgi:3',5'-cyclic AMP phosphodiesterase CpdA